jgi:putative membrane protein
MGPHPPFGIQGDRGFGDTFSVLPLLGAALLVAALLLLGTVVYRMLKDRAERPELLAATAPDDEARRILAERFARSEISSDEFLERASILNWTPGSNVSPPASRRSQRR